MNATRTALLVVWVLLLSAPLAHAGPPTSENWREWPVIPVWLARGAEIVADAPGAKSLAPSAVECPSIMEFSLTNDEVAVHFDPVQMVTQLYVGDAANDRILRHDIDAALNRTETAIPMPYGLPWLAVDLDLDGNIELVVQRGDVGFGGNGYLDIHSAPDWELRGHFVFPDAKVAMYPVAINMDGDPYLEIYVTPNSIFGASRAVIIDYAPDADSFAIVADIIAPLQTSGQPAVGDFDQDGRVEFISGNIFYYGLFEYDGETLSYIGQVGDTVYWNNFSAAAVRPKPGGLLHALLGHSEGSGGGFSYRLLEPIGDNSFDTALVFHEFTGAVGIHPCYGVDTDCDGLDELFMTFYPTFKCWEWDTTLGTFAESCVWDEDSLGTFVHLRAVDLDQNGRAELAAIDHRNFFRAFPGLDCIGCDSLGQCPHAGPYCACDCHGDPQCDGTPDVLDIVRAVEVAFRNMPAVPDPHPFCLPAQTDVDCSGETDVFDVVRFVNVIFRNEDQAANYCDPCIP